MGSGTELKEDIKKLGKTAFKKEVLKLFSTRRELSEEEARVVTRELVDDPMCYNRSLGGGYNNPGDIVVKDKNSGKYKLISHDEYTSNKDLYETTNSGKVTVNFKENPKDNYFLISSEEYHQNKDKYVLAGSENFNSTKVQKGCGLFVNKDDPNDYKALSMTDELVKSGQYVNAFLGKHHTDETKRKISKKLSEMVKGEKNPMYGKHWYTNGSKDIALSDTDQIPEGFVRGKLRNEFYSNKAPKVPIRDVNQKIIRAINLKTKELKNFSDDANIPDGWVKTKYYSERADIFLSPELLQDLYSKTNSWTKVAEQLKKDRECLRSVISDYEAQGYVFKSDVKVPRPKRKGQVTKGFTGKRFIYDPKTLEEKVIDASELQDYLDKGWISGKATGQNLTKEEVLEFFSKSPSLRKTSGHFKTNEARIKVILGWNPENAFKGWYHNDSLGLCTTIVATQEIIDYLKSKGWENGKKTY